ncbi:MAG: methylenetetrahydrofolate reductase C-terminal domain-containing protein [Endomicrobium sp.]|jgi:hypothetical protein|nr:methylenetetrahydrofolate reductase C-terminal domain-containing protein [Endomicrobium sp.]
MIEQKQNDGNLKAFYKRNGCAKGYINGPCGGFVSGKCEVDYTKDCVWVLVYEKLKKNGNLKKFVNQYVAPV